MSNDASLRWFVAHTRPHAEATATSHLARQGFETYLPRYLKRRRHARKIETVAAPLFPRYLFIAVDMAAQRWRSIHSTVGVVRLVCHGQDPTPIATEVVEELRRREDAGGFIRLDQRASFARGDKVRVVDGAFAPCFGLFEGMRDSDRVAVLIELLGRKVRVVLDDLSVVAA